MSVNYDRVSQWFHWILAALIFFLIAYHPSTEEGHEISSALNVTIHVTVGISILFLVFGRLFWRLNYARSPERKETSKHHSQIRKAVHSTFYFFMLATPIIGIILALVSELDILILGFLEMPNLISNDRLHDLLRSLHGASADSLLYLAIIHVGAAIYHRIWLKENILTRMTEP